MKTITVINQKGGVCKTTTALTIGEGLGRKGYNVLFVDLDPQGNMSYTLGADEAGRYTIVDALRTPEKVEETIKTGVRYKCSAIPSSHELSLIDTILPAKGREYRLRDALIPLKERYDYCIIDTPPALGTLTINALTASESVIIPTLADAYSIKGIYMLTESIETVKRYTNPGLYIRGILITKYNGRSNIKRALAENLEGVAELFNTRLFKTRIRESVAMLEAQILKKSIFDYSPRSNTAIDYSSLITEVLESEKRTTTTK